MYKHLTVLLGSVVTYVLSNNSNIRVKESSDGKGKHKFSLSLKDVGGASETSSKEDENKESVRNGPLNCDIVRGCVWSRDEGLLDSPELIEFENDMFGENLNEKINYLESKYGKISHGKESDEILLSLALARTIKAVDGGDHFDDKLMMRAVENLDMVTKRRLELSSSTALKAARLASLQTKLLLMRSKPREKLFEKIGEFLFLEGRLLAAREAFQIALRIEGNQDLRLNILSNPATVIKAILSKAIEIQYLSHGSCQSEASDCQKVNEKMPIMKNTKLNSMFWTDLSRSIIHEKLEWWIAKSKPMAQHFQSLQEAIYTAGIEAGVYLSRYQRPINAIEGLRAKPVWTDRETGFKDSLDKIRENWKVIRDEGQELMKDKRIWGVDPGWRGLPSSRGWWGEVPIKGVALHKASEQAQFCKNALFTCRMIQQFPEASGCPKCKASFSLVQAGTVIPAHAGPTNTRLRAHLGLVVPKSGDVHMRIANQTVSWKPGKWTIIDDSFEHQIVNESQKPRLILIIDFHHPDIKREENKSEFNWSKQDMRDSGLARSEYISGGFP